MSEEHSHDLYVLTQAMRSLSNRILFLLCEAAVDAMTATGAPASATKHHCRRFGLLEHTAEVVEIALATAGAPLFRGRGLDRDVLITAAILHDVAKTQEYCLTPDGSTIALPYRKYVRHVAGGVAWMDSFLERSNYALDHNIRLAVQHAMLAHHGRQEWGSPVEPITLEAQILHYADMLSAQPGEPSPTVPTQPTEKEQTRP